MAQAPDRGPRGFQARAVQGSARNRRRRDPREPRGRAAEAAARARHRLDHLLAARDGNEPSHRQRNDEPALVGALQRSDPPRLLALSREVRRRVPASSEPRRPAEELHPGTRALREGARLHRLQPESGHFGRILEGPAAHRQVVVSALREDGRARRSRDGPRQRVLQSELPRDRRPLHHRRHLQGFPGAQVQHPARGRGGALPLGPLPGPRAGHEAAAAEGARHEQRLLRYLRVSPGRHRLALEDHPGGQHPVRLRDGRRSERCGPGDRLQLRRHQALHRRGQGTEQGGQGEDFPRQREEGVPALRGATREHYCTRAGADPVRPREIIPPPRGPAGQVPADWVMLRAGEGSFFEQRKGDPVSGSFWMIWPNNAVLSALILFVIAMPFLYAARKLVHELFRSIGNMVGGPFRLGARWLFATARDMKERNKAVLLAHGREEVGQLIEREFERVGALVTRDLEGYPALQRKLLDEITRVEEDYKKCGEVPPPPHDWVEAVAGIAKIKSEHS